MRSSRHCFFRLVLLTACLSGLASSAAPKPNILFILVDDLAWTDLGCYGHAWHETPNIDQLAKKGLRFTQAYSPAPICSSARASILSGKTPARLGLEFVVKAEPGVQRIEPPPPLQAPPFTLALDLSEVTVAERLKGGGYQTAFFGKWHLNPHYQGRYLAWSPSHGPAQQGFDLAEEDFGSHPYSRRSLPQLTHHGGYHPDGITERAIRFLRSSPAKPFFLMVSHFYVHTPVQTTSEWLRDKYRAKIPNEVANREKRVEYAAFVETLDHHVGGLLNALAGTRLEKETLVVFLSDNGGHPEYVSHRPLRGSKWNLYEGGIRVPMLVSWPGMVPKGGVCETPVIGYDLFPTFCELAKLNDDGLEGERDGTSLVPLFADPLKTLDRSLYWHFPYYHPEGAKFGRSHAEIEVDDFAVSQTRPHSAIRHGVDKLLWYPESDRTELYRLSDDLSEQSNLVDSQSERAQHLKGDLLSYLRSVGARMAQERVPQ